MNDLFFVFYIKSSVPRPRHNRRIEYPQINHETDAPRRCMEIANVETSRSHSWSTSDAELTDAFSTPDTICRPSSEEEIP